MALTIPDDAYISVEEATAYHEKRTTGAIWAVITDEKELEQRLVVASDYIDYAYTYLGKKSSPSQPRQFPRSSATEIPREIKQACAELALKDGLFNNQKAGNKVTQIGPLRFEKFDNAANQPRFEFIDNLLKGLIANDDDVQHFTPMARS